MSPPTKTRQGGVDGQEVGIAPTKRLLFGDFLPPGSLACRRLPCGHIIWGLLLGVGLGELLAEVARGLSLRTSRALSLLSLTTPTTLCPHRAGRNRQTAFPTPGPRTPAKAVLARCATPLWMELSGSLAWLNGGWEGQDPPEAPGSPWMLGGGAYHRLGLWAWRVGMNEFLARTPSLLWALALEGGRSCQGYASFAPQDPPGPLGANPAMTGRGVLWEAGCHLSGKHNQWLPLSRALPLWARSRPLPASAE